MTAATMERNGTEVGQSLEYLGVFKWNEIHNLKPSPTGIGLTKPVEDMWSNKGLIERKTDTRNGRTFDIIFDKDFVADQVYRLFVSLGIYKNGEINKEYLEEVIEYSIEYSLKEDERQQHQELLRLAKPYVEEGKLTQEDAIQFVKDQRAFMENWIKERETKSKK